jgi:hypothetical protein
MENREEIKAGVKNKLIEIMAEQIAKDDNFEKLKAELMSEMLGLEEKEPVDKLDEVIKEIKSPIIQTKQNSSWMKYFGFPYNKEVIEERMQKLTTNRGIQSNIFVKGTRDMRATLEDIKAGKLPASLLTFPPDNSNEPDYGTIALRYDISSETDNSKSSLLGSIIGSQLKANSLNMMSSIEKDYKEALDKFVDKNVEELTAVPISASIPGITTNIANGFARASSLVPAGWDLGVNLDVPLALGINTPLATSGNSTHKIKKIRLKKKVAVSKKTKSASKSKRANKK